MKIDFHPVSSISDETIEANRRHSLSFNFPLHTDRTVSKERLAIVGSGLSISGKLEELKCFDGDLWGVNGAVSWLLDHDIDAALFSACMAPDWSYLDQDIFKSVQRAVLSWSCSPELFEMLPQGVDVTLVKSGEPGRAGGTATVVGAAIIALEMGYREVHFYGTECCFGLRSHIDRDEKLTNKLVITCNDQLFVTNPQMLFQSYELGQLIKGCPGVLFDKSGGLLAARMIDSEYDVISFSEAA